jgi:D-arabinitol dehydrogenase (NADP+)
MTAPLHLTWSYEEFRTHALAADRRAQSPGNWPGRPDPLARRRGTVMYYGVTGPGDLVRLSPFDIFRREITIKGSFAEIFSFPAAIEALRSGQARTDGLITHRFALADYGKAVEALANDRSVHKIVLVP